MKNKISLFLFSSFVTSFLNAACVEVCDIGAPDAYEIAYNTACTASGGTPLGIVYAEPCACIFVSEKSCSPLDIDMDGINDVTGLAIDVDPVTGLPVNIPNSSLPQLDAATGGVLDTTTTTDTTSPDTSCDTGMVFDGTTCVPLQTCTEIESASFAAAQTDCINQSLVLVSYNCFEDFINQPVVTHACSVDDGSGGLTSSDSATLDTTEIEHKLDRANLSLTGINTKLDTSNTNLSNTNTNLSSIISKLDTSNTNLLNINSGANTANSKLDSVNSNLSSSNSKLDSVNSNLSSSNNLLTDIKNILNQSGDFTGFDISGVNSDSDVILDSTGAFYDSFGEKFSNIVDDATSIKTDFDNAIAIVGGSDLPTSYTVSASSAACDISFTLMGSSVRPLEPLPSILSKYSAVFSLFVYVSMMIGNFKFLFKYFALGTK